MVITAENTNQKPGYKQTEVGMIPEDWKACSLGDIVTKVGSGITPTGGEKVYKREGHPFLRSQNVGWGHLLVDDIVFIDEATHCSFLATEIKIYDVLLNITGASIGRSAVADERLLGGNVNQHVCIIRTDASKLNPYYLNYFLLSKNGQKQIDSFQAGGNRQGLNFGQIKSFQIPLPPFPEQRAIATALSDVDALITSLDKLIAKRRDIKQATMQQLLSGKRRLPGFGGDYGTKVRYKRTEVGIIPEDWEVKKLGDVAKIYRGASPRPIEDPKWFNEYSSIGWVRISDVTKSVKYLFNTTQKLSEQGVKQSRFVKHENLIMSICATIGKPIITKLDVCIHDGFVIFEKPKVKIEYLYYYLSSIEDNWSKTGQTGSQMNLNTTIIGNENISFPIIQTNKPPLLPSSPRWMLKSLL